MKHKLIEVTPEIEGKLRQYKRVLLSYADFKHATLASGYILDAHLHQKYPTESYILLEALNCSMIMAYCRPFSGNDSGVPRPVPDLSLRLPKILTPDERRIHDVAMHDRNKVLAHSDSDAAQIDPVVWELPGHQIVMPLRNWGLAPLTEETTVIFHSASEKLLRATHDEQERLEPQLMPYLRRTGEGNPFREST